MLAATEKSRFEVGQWVLLVIGRNHLEAQVLEDRGRLGVNGERVYLILVSLGEGVEPQQREAAESRLIPKT
jgi:hypothetical protein